MENKQMARKIILGIMVFIFVLPFSQFVLSPNISLADNTGLNWENPNANGDNPYKVTTDAILNSQTMMQVVGCTGLVDKVTTAITGFVQDKAKDLLKSAAQKAKEKILAHACDVGKGTLEAPSALTPNLTISQAISDGYKCPDIIKTEDSEQAALTKKTIDLAAAKEKREACFNGLAYTLAKNQLTSMTRETVNWVNQGFNGNPLYVQNIRSLTNSIEQNVIETGVDVIANGAFPYGGDFNNTLIRSYNGGAMNGAAKYLDSLTSDLSAFLTDTTSYGNYDPNDTNAARQRAMQANDAFSNDFSVGGWDGYLALTQRDQNNPLGFTMAASQYVADRIDQQANETKSEVAQNNGFLNQKECILWQVYGSNKKPVMKDTNKVLFSGVSLPDGTTTKDVMVTAMVTSPTQTTDYDKCINWKTTTPGSIIKDKLTTYINSPERQLELADDINKSLSNLFTKLIENFRSEGLLGLSQEKYSAIDSSVGGYGVNGTNVDTNLGVGYSPSYYGSGSGYNNDSFDLTRDLGNTYIHSDTVSLGNWDAKNNIPELNINLGPSHMITDADGTHSEYYPSGYYYTVSVAGNTKLFDNGYTGWAVGDRAFWNGTEWQDWKCGPLKSVTDPITKVITKVCSVQTSPVAKRGVIQTQEDYIVAAKEILKVLPSIMPKIGELDYCIPGPNPSFENNSGETGTAFNEFAASLQSTYKAGSFFERDSLSFSIAQKGDPLYDNYANIFKWDPKLWTSIQDTTSWKSLNGNSINGKTIKKDSNEQTVMDNLAILLSKIQNDIKTFYTDYTNLVFKGIYGTMRSKYIENEQTGESTPNPSYVPMIEDGYVATKDIVSTNDQLTTASQDYHDAITEAQSNTNKLNIIRNQVGVIIKAAQDRRDNDPSFNNALLAYYPGKTLDEAKKLYEQYKIDNKSCFDEEDISYYDSDSLIVNNSIVAERCNDGIDNDLDGLIDKQDPDCAKTNTNNTGTNNNDIVDLNPTVSTCVISSSVKPQPYSSSINVTDSSKIKCTARTNQTCTKSLYYSTDGNKYTCSYAKSSGLNTQ